MTTRLLAGFMAVGALLAAPLAPDSDCGALFAPTGVALDAAAMPELAPAGALVPLPAVPAESTVRVLIAASAAASAEPDLQAVAEHAIASANQSFANGGLQIAVELAGVVTTDYAEVGLRDDLAALRAGRVGDVEAKREEVRADLVSMLVMESDLCGSAYINSSAATAFSVANIDCVRTGLTFTHEIGHNFGADHDPANADGEYPYGHGYAVPGKYRTIMSYPCPQVCPRVNHWSSPTGTYEGEPLGDSASDNARVLRERVAEVAAFR